MADPQFAVTGIDAGRIAADLSNVQISFGTKQGPPLVCNFQPAVLDRVIMRLCEMIQHVRNQTLAKGGRLSVVALDLTDAGASSPVGGGKVILSIRGTNGVIQNYSLLPDIAARLRSELQGAEESARQQGAQTRQ